MKDRNRKKMENIECESEENIKKTDDQKLDNSINHTVVNNMFMSRWKLLFGVSFMLAFVSILFLFLSLLIPQLNNGKKVPPFNDYNDALSEFKENTNIKTEWLQDIQLPDSIVSVNIMDSTIIFNGISDLDPVRFSYNNKNKNIIHVEDSVALETILQLFNIGESNSVSEIAQKINANPYYVQEIEKANISKHDIVFSLIYNTVVGDNQGHIAVTIKNSKLNVVRELRYDSVNKLLFVSSVNKLLAQDTLSVKKKFAISGCKPEINSPLSRISQVDSIQWLINSFFNSDSVVVLDNTFKMDFVYYNLNSNKLYIGNKRLTVSESNNRTINYVDAIKKNHDSIYYINSDSTLLALNAKTIKITDPSFLWGKIDTKAFDNGILKNEDIALKYDLIRIWGGNIVITYFALLLVLSYIIFSVIYIIKKAMKKEIETEGSPTNDKDSSSSLNDDSYNNQNAKNAHGLNKSAIKSIKHEAILSCQSEVKEKFGYDENKDFNSMLDEVLSKTQLYEKIVNFTSETDLFEFLNENKPKHVKTPVVSPFTIAIKKLYEHHKMFENEDVFIVELFKIIDNELSLNLSMEYTQLKNKVAEYDLCQSLLTSTNLNISFYKYLSNKINEFNRNQSTIIDCVDFALLFNLQPVNANEEIITVYKSTQKLVNEVFAELRKFTPTDDRTDDFWNRKKLSAVAIEKLYELLRIWGETHWLMDIERETIERTNRDLSQYYLLYYIFIEAIDRNNSIDEVSSGLRQRLNLPTVNNNLLEDNFEDDLKTLFRKVRGYDISMDFVTKMWNMFVSDFKQHEETSDDKAWFFEHLINIAYHTVDYIGFIKNNYVIEYYPNLILLQNDFDFSKTTHLEYIKNHADKSTPYSNRVNTWMEELGVKKLKILIDKYNLKP